MRTNTDEKLTPWPVVALLVLCVLVFHYLFISAEVAQNKATDFMNPHYYPLISNIMKMGAIPYIFVFIFVGGYAKAEEYSAVDKKEVRKLIKPNLLLRSIFIFVFAFFVFYQISWIYIYIEQVGDNPLLTWSEYVNYLNTPYYSRHM